jgi:CelD/BcsL family acetyltransferase involved in cellulose biosynthesis
MMLSRSHRKRCRKLQRQFFDSGKIQVRQVVCEANLMQGFKILLQLHGARWGTDKERLGVFADKRFYTFHETIAGKLLRRHQLRLAWLEYNGKPLAAEYQFFDAKSVYAYQAGIDLDMDEYSPGRLSMMAAIQFAIRQGCEYFDLLRGDEPYKSNWRAVSSACFDIRVWPNSFVCYPEYLLWFTHTLVVKWLKPLLPESFINCGLKFLRSNRKT